MTWARIFFWVISVIFVALGGSFFRALDGFSNLRGVSQICGGIHVWYVALKNVFGGIYRISYVSRLFMTYILPIQTFKTFVQGEINKILQKSGVEERHLVVGFNNTLATRSRFEREWKSGLHKVSWQIINFLGKLLKLLPHTFKIPLHLWDRWDQKVHHRNPLKNGSLSENVMKEGERVLFQPLHWKSNRRGLRCGHFATSTDLIASF